MVASPAAARAVAPPADRTVLLLPVEAKGGASPDTAAVLTQMMAAEGSKSPGLKLVSFKEVESTMSQEQLRQVSGCNSNTCAAEIAGALNTDEIVIATFGKVGDSYVLTAVRIRAGDAQAVARVSARFRDLDENLVLDRLPELMRKLLTDEAGASAAASHPAPVAGSSAAPAGESPPAGANRNPSRILVGLGGGALAGSGLVMLGAAGAAAASAISFIPWVVSVPTQGLTGVPRLVLLTGLPLGAAACAGGLLLLSVALAVAGAAGVGAGFWRAP
ncbi:MAG: hypothetical protein HY904_13160 [Deltaproteobacteria bacterium]|nr:hypothetical protein [Deltaproteobacteria bacterium]